MSSRKIKLSSKGSPERKHKHSASRRQHHEKQSKHDDDESNVRFMHDLSYWLGRLQVKEDDAKSLRAWKQQNHDSTYEVLSHPVRHGLNKFVFDVTPTPSKAQRKQLWYDLQMIDCNVRMSKITRWFQNKRQYMKRQYGASEPTPAAATGGSQQLKSQDKKRMEFLSASDADRNQESSYESSSSELESDSESD